MAARLLATTGPRRKSEFPLGEEVSIGRDALQAICLEDPTVSPEHCNICLRDGHYVLCDLDSRSGTFVNGIPTKERVLQSGDELTIGSSVFLFTEESSAQAAQRAPPGGAHYTKL